MPEWKFVRVERTEAMHAAAQSTPSALLTHGHTAEIWSAMLAAAPPPPVQQGEAVANLWQELLDKDDRTSPEDYPDMALITREELADFIARTAPPSREEGLREAAEVARSYIGGEYEAQGRAAEEIVEDILSLASSSTPSREEGLREALQRSPDLGLVANHGHRGQRNTLRPRGRRSLAGDRVEWRILARGRNSERGKLYDL